MAAAAEEGLVQNRYFQDGDLQPCDQCLERVGEGAVVEDEFEQHRYEVDHILIDFTNYT